MISEGKEAAEVQRRKDEAAPPVEEWKKQFGSKVKVDEKTGAFELNLREPADIKRAFEMQEGTRRIDVERGAILQARMKREKVVRRDGRMVEFPEELIEQSKHRFRPAGRHGGAPSVRFGMSESFGRYEQGPNGLWFVWNDGWEPTTLFGGEGLTGHQRDPDGNLWVHNGVEWLLEDEVA